MPPDQDTATLAVVVARLEDVGKQLERMQDTLTAQRTEFVGRGEWLMRNAAVDDSFRGQGREIGELRTELRSRRHPWPTVAAVVVAGSALALELVPRLVG